MLVIFISLSIDRPSMFFRAVVHLYNTSCYTNVIIILQVVGIESIKFLNKKKVRICTLILYTLSD